MRFRLAPKVTAGILFLSVLPFLVIPTVEASTGPGRVLVPVSWGRGHPPPYTLSVALMVDEEWTVRFGADAERQARAILDSANQAFAPAEIHLHVASFGTWTSPNDAGGIRDLYRALLSTLPGAADIVVAFTAQYRGQEGGIASPDRRHVLIKHHSYRADHDALVLAHEIGHILGLDHHTCSHRYCIMSSHYYDERRHFCPEHLRLLRANGGFFQYLSALSHHDAD